MALSNAHPLVYCATMFYLAGCESHNVLLEHSGLWCGSSIQLIWLHYSPTKKPQEGQTANYAGSDRIGFSKDWNPFSGQYTCQSQRFRRAMNLTGSSRMRFGRILHGMRVNLWIAVCKINALYLSSDMPHSPKWSIQAILYHEPMIHSSLRIFRHLWI